MNAHKVVPGLLMAAGLTLPVAATVEFLSHVGGTSLAVAPKPATHSGTGKQTPPAPSGTGGGHPTPPAAASGTFTGIPAQGYFGPVTAKITVQNGKITSVGIDAPKDNPTSAYINSVVVPMLQKETLKAQSAKINGVSGATVTSEFYYQSLVSALKQAHLQ